MCPLPSKERERHLTAVKKNMCQIQTLFRKENCWSQVQFYCPFIHLTKQMKNWFFNFFSLTSLPLSIIPLCPEITQESWQIFFFSKMCSVKNCPTKGSIRKRVPWSNRFGKSWVLVFMLGYSGSTDIFSKLFMQEIHFLLLSRIPINSSWKIIFKILV